MQVASSYMACATSTSKDADHDGVGLDDRKITRAGASVRKSVRHILLGRRSGIIGEIHVAVGLRPQSDAPGDRLGQRVLEMELAVEIALDLDAGDADFELVPLSARGRRIANPF